MASPFDPLPPSRPDKPTPAPRPEDAPPPPGSIPEEPLAPTPTEPVSPTPEPAPPPIFSDFRFLPPHDGHEPISDRQELRNRELPQSP